MKVRFVLLSLILGFMALNSLSQEASTVSQPKEREGIASAPS
ncbi:MAG: hypothetical protein RMK94_08005 [Armatimonadota bacterium]|nr:hypothetical protein [Armatimonadota bacterium]